MALYSHYSRKTFLNNELNLTIEKQVIVIVPEKFGFFLQCEFQQIERAYFKGL